MGIFGLVVNNLSELIALAVIFLVGFWAGKLVQKHFPNFHLAPWNWSKRSNAQE